MKVIWALLKGTVSMVVAIATMILVPIVLIVAAIGLGNDEPDR